MITSCFEKKRVRYSALWLFFFFFQTNILGGYLFANASVARDHCVFDRAECIGVRPCDGCASSLHRLEAILDEMGQLFITPQLLWRHYPSAPPSVPPLAAIHDKWQTGNTPSPLSSVFLFFCFSLSENHSVTVSKVIGSVFLYLFYAMLSIDWQLVNHFLFFFYFVFKFKLDPDKLDTFFGLIFQKYTGQGSARVAII